MNKKVHQEKNKTNKSSKLGNIFQTGSVGETLLRGNLKQVHNKMHEIFLSVGIWKCTTITKNRARV